MLFSTMTVIGIQRSRDLTRHGFHLGVQQPPKSPCGVPTEMKISSAPRVASPSNSSGFDHANFGRCRCPYSGRRRNSIAWRKRIQHSLHPIRYPKLVVDTKKMVLNRVLTHFKFFG